MIPIDVYRYRSTMPQIEMDHVIAKFAELRDADVVGAGTSPDEALGQLVRVHGERVGIELAVKVREMTKGRASGPTQAGGGDFAGG